MDVLIGAGSLIDASDPLAARFEGSAPKALLPLAGKPMVQWVLDAVAGSRHLERVFISGLAPEQGLRCGDKLIRYLPAEASLVDSVLAGARAMQASGASVDRALWVGADLPLVRAEMLDWFAAQVLGAAHDGYLPVIDHGLMRRRFPDAVRTALRFRDRTVFVGDVYAGDTRIALGPVHPVWQAMTAARKSPAKIAARVGAWPLALYAAGRLTSAHALRIARERFGLDVTMVDCPWAEMGMDVDKPSHYDIVARELARRG